MQLYILDRDPNVSAQKLVDNMGYKYSFKMLIELGQLICSAGLSDTYKKIPQGKAQQEFVGRHKCYIFNYFAALKKLCLNSEMNIKPETKTKLTNIGLDILYKTTRKDCIEPPLVEAPFRYSKDYVCNISTDTWLPIDECIKCYEDYIEWKRGK
jgi:hypothetical protein